MPFEKIVKFKFHVKFTSWIVLLASLFENGLKKKSIFRNILFRHIFMTFIKLLRKGLHSKNVVLVREQSAGKHNSMHHKQISNVYGKCKISMVQVLARNLLNLKKESQALTRHLRVPLNGNNCINSTSSSSHSHLRSMSKSCIPLLWKP